MKNFGASGIEMDDEAIRKRRAAKEEEYDREIIKLTELANTRTAYQDNGDKLIDELRNY